MKTTINSGALRRPPTNETLLLECNPLNVKAFIPRKLSWNEIISSEVWNLEEVSSPIPSNRLLRPNPFIIQDKDGNVIIDFNPPTTPSIREEFKNGPSSVSSVSSNYKFKGVDFQPNLPQTIYEEKYNESISLTRYDMEASNSHLGIHMI